MKKVFWKKLKVIFSDVRSRAAEKQLICKIKGGIKNKEFKIHLQFIVENKEKKIALAEALSRWETSTGEVVMPGKYIGIMEKSGLIIDFDYYMFEMVCEKISKWAGTEMAQTAISCNFTRITISEKDFVKKIKDIADKYVFDRSKLIIEITEDAFEKNKVVAVENIHAVKALGFTIALDDIGSGTSSITGMCRYPVDIAKIDRKVLGLTDTPKGKKLFVGIVALAHSLGLTVVCEGVETDEQNEFVFGSDCDYIQGWYYSKALPEEKAEEFALEYMKNFPNGQNCSKNV